MSSITSVLVPGAAAPAGINTIKSLRIAKYRGKIVSTDSRAMSAGFFMSDNFEVLPETDNGIYKEKLFDVLEKYKIQVLMPSSGFDIYKYSDYKNEISQLGAVAVVSDRKQLEICRDKLLTYNTLRGKFNIPFTTENPEKIDVFPVIAKPRFGKGSRDIFRIDDESELNYVCSKYDQMIFQELLPGTEFTIDVLSDLNAKAIVAVPRIRMQTKGGISTQGKIVRMEELENSCMQMAESVGIVGPCCIQMKESQDGSLKLVEINPRMGGGTIFATLAGANFPALIIDMIEGKKIKVPKISEVMIIRYFEEIVVNDSEVVVAVAPNLISQIHHHV